MLQTILINISDCFLFLFSEDSIILTAIREHVILQVFSIRSLSFDHLIHVYHIFDIARKFIYLTHVKYCESSTDLTCHQVFIYY